MIVVSPPVCAQPAYVQPRRRINPLIPICAISIPLFLIAATIVLALIPVYLPSRGSNDNQSVGFRTSLALQNGNLPVGTLNNDNCRAIESVIRQQAQSSSAVNPSVPTVISCTVSTNTTAGRRKRQALGNQIDLVGFLSGAGICRSGVCLTERANALINRLLSRGSFIINLILSDGTRSNILANFNSGSTFARALSISVSTNKPDLAIQGSNNQNQSARVNAPNSKEKQPK